MVLTINQVSFHKGPFTSSFLQLCPVLFDGPVVLDFREDKDFQKSCLVGFVVVVDFGRQIIV